MTVVVAPRLSRAARTPGRGAWCCRRRWWSWLWWRFGWQVGLPAMVASHAPFWWATLVPDSALFSPVLRRLPTDAQVAWLTIDDGPSQDTRAVLDLLDAFDAKATFFLVGERARAHPELVREIARRGHGIGNHSATHPQAWFWALPPTRMRDEIERTQATLRELTGTTPHWFRAVVGMANPFVAAVLKAHGLTRVAWSARGYDAFASRSATRCRSHRTAALARRDRVAARRRETRPQCRAPVRAVLERLQARGYRAVLPG